MPRWSARVTDLPPGTALDLGSGEGGDAIWLARKGWRVTAADISGVALRRAARHAEEAGVASRSTGSATTSASRSPRAPTTSSPPATCTPARTCRASGSCAGPPPRSRPAGCCWSPGTPAGRPGSSTTTRTCTSPRRRRCSTPWSRRRGSGRCCAARSSSAPRTTPTAGRRPAGTTCS
ncbi:class I SAM-dependent methyltransferase [Nonomuraea rubra]|uniref:class I SAM-dependent methyltransferase n=1 Tax=Nonomuraea rubra TaxID=46180 RepID=UPI0031F18169